MRAYKMLVAICAPRQLGRARRGHLAAQPRGAGPPAPAPRSGGAGDAPGFPEPATTEEVWREEREETVVVRFRLAGDERTFGFRIELSVVGAPCWEGPIIHPQDQLPRARCTREGPLIWRCWCPRGCRLVKRPSLFSPA